MEDTSVILPALILLGLAAYILYTLSSLIVQIVRGYWNFSMGYSDANNPSRLRRDHPVVMSLLNKFSYYGYLSPRGKDKFAGRVVRFLADKKMLGMEGLVITDEIRVMISAAATQLTFGLEKHMLLHFHTIQVYPQVFFSKMADAHLKGGATPRGRMMLSWKDFQHGYAAADDKLNLGLHEMAHALLLDMLHGAVSNEHLEAEIGRWERSGDRVLEELRQKNPHFLRGYGAANEHEFFAVCVEHFFESPVEFRNRLPDVYFSLCRLLNQDPLNVHRDYRFDR